jgi:5,10-methylenetetrahydromethanopterin reductase
MEIGLGLQTCKRPDEYVAIGRAAEAAGIEVLSVYQDLFFQPAFGPLLVMARETERVRLGPAALNPQTLHPVEIAGQVATLDLVSNGRAYLGLVCGAWLEQVGLEQPRPLTALREAVELVRRLLAGDRDGFVGSRFSLAPGAGLQYEPLRTSVPLMIGTWSRRTAAFAGEVAQEVKLGGSANPDMVRVVRDWIGNDQVRIVVGAVTVVDEDGTAARARAQEAVELYLPVVAHRDVTLELRPGQPAPLDKFALVGTPEDVAAQVRRLFEAGADRIELGEPHGLSQPTGLDLIVRRLLPLLRG